MESSGEKNITVISAWGCKFFLFIPGVLMAGNNRGEKYPTTYRALYKDPLLFCYDY
jgi:hypothetical protein